jgi:hypothetical protein
MASMDRTIQLRRLAFPWMALRKTTEELLSFGIGEASKTAA